MNHSFNILAAKEIGVEEAVIAETIRHWTAYNAANNNGLRNGRHWTYNSASAWCEIYPYWSHKQIYRILHSLRDQGIILIEQPGGCDRRLWVAFTDKGMSMFPFGNMEVPKQADAPPGSGVSYTITNTVTEPVSIPNTDYVLAEKVYEHYPRKVARPVAMKAIARAVKKHGFDHVLSKTKEYASHVVGKEMRYIPYPATFYNQEQYNDDWGVSQPKQAESKQTMLATLSAVRSLIAKHPCNWESRYATQNPTEEQLYEYKTLRNKETFLVSAIAKS